MYSTSKHAVRGFTDALRDEVLHEELPISVTLIKPAAINILFPRHAKNNLDRDATLPSPVYDVDLVADRPADHAYEGLHASRGFHLACGDVDRDRHIAKVSLYGIARRHPLATTLIAAAGATAVGLLVRAHQDE
jgi:NAD(P)-dependent dehydrogenase (short-subunit alcohol dehydrogenase family)